jgi:hypothetical protein
VAVAVASVALAVASVALAVAAVALAAAAMPPPPAEAARAHLIPRQRMGASCLATELVLSVAKLRLVAG